MSAFGSLGDMAACLVDVRSSPNNGHQAAVLQCPLSQNLTYALQQTNCGGAVL